MKYSLGDRRVTCKGDYWIAENATVIGSVVLENNASIWFNCVVRGDNDLITIGEDSQLQDGCVVHIDEGHPLVIGRQVSIGHMAMLHGCTIGDGTLVGIGAVILNHARIGRNCLVGARALVTEGKEFPDGSLIVGSPAVAMRSLSAEQIERVKHAATHYVDNAKRFRAGLTRVG